MSSHPSAMLVYGVDLGADDEWDSAVGDPDVLEEEGQRKAVNQALTAAGITGVTVDWYGNLGSYTRCFLRLTGYVEAWAYDPMPVDPEALTVSEEEMRNLRAAWELINPGAIMPTPGWQILLRYA